MHRFGGDIIYGLKRAVGAWCAVVIGLVICLVPLSGCDDGQKMSDPKASLEQAAIAYWTARFIDRDYKAAYEMELEKGTLPFEKYLERVRNAGEIAYKSIRVDTVKTEDGKGFVTLMVACRLPSAPVDQELPLKDVWTLESNQWRHVLPQK